MIRPAHRTGNANLEWRGGVIGRARIPVEDQLVIRVEGKRRGHAHHRAEWRR